MARDPEPGPRRTSGTGMDAGTRHCARGAAAPDRELGEAAPLPLVPAIATEARCAVRTAALLSRHRIRQPRRNVGRRITFADGTTGEVYRETVIQGAPRTDPVVLVVGFRLLGARSERAHALFRCESELNTVLFAGFPGLVSKLWLRHDERCRYRGVYEWDGADRAVAYVRALWWALALVSDPASIGYAVLPGLRPDQVLADPGVIGTVTTAEGGWWRPVRVEGSATA